MLTFIRVKEALPGPDDLLWVRQAWVGLELPAFGPGTAEVNDFAFITSDGRPTTSLLIGYWVNSGFGLSILDQAQPEAARWLMDNIAELSEGPGAYIWFSTRCCEEVEDQSTGDWIRDEGWTYEDLVREGLIVLDPEEELARCYDEWVAMNQPPLENE
ncbi:MAG: hypothetical protein WCP91_02755 [Candidatus Berkelbacteria bacterium]